LEAVEDIVPALLPNSIASAASAQETPRDRERRRRVDRLVALTPLYPRRETWRRLLGHGRALANAEGPADPGGARAARSGGTAAFRLGERRRSSVRWKWTMGALELAQCRVKGRSWRRWRGPAGWAHTISRSTRGPSRDGNGPRSRRGLDRGLLASSFRREQLRKTRVRSRMGRAGAPRMTDGVAGEARWTSTLGKELVGVGGGSTADAPLRRRRRRQDSLMRWKG